MGTANADLVRAIHRERSGGTADTADDQLLHAAHAGEDGEATWAEARAGTGSARASRIYAARLSTSNRSSDAGRSLQDLSAIAAAGDHRGATLIHSSGRTQRFFAKSQTEPHIPTKELKAMLLADAARNVHAPLLLTPRSRAGEGSSSYGGDDDERGPRTEEGLEETDVDAEEDSGHGLPPQMAPTASFSPCLQSSHSSPQGPHGQPPPPPPLPGPAASAPVPPPSACVSPSVASSGDRSRGVVGAWGDVAPTVTPTMSPRAGAGAPALAASPKELSPATPVAFGSIFARPTMPVPLPPTLAHGGGGVGAGLLDSPKRPSVSVSEPPPRPGFGEAEGGSDRGSPAVPLHTSFAGGRGRSLTPTRAYAGAAFADHPAYQPPQHPPHVPDDGSPASRPAAAPPLSPASPHTSAPTTPAARPPPPVEMKWKRGQMIGQGAFGKVWVGLSLDTGMLMAVKQIVFNPSVKDIADQLRKLQYEIKLMKQLSHPNIVRYLCTERCGSSVNIFMEYVAGGSISTVLKEFGPLDEPAIKSYSTQIAHALAHLHSHRIIHRDVKGGNVLLEVEGNCKVCDFGTAAYIHELAGGRTGASNAPQGTPNWMAPEVITEEPYNEACDIWSFGCTLLEMLTAAAPFVWISHLPAAVMLHIAQAKRNGDKCIDIPRAIRERVSPSCQHLLSWCLSPAPENRPSAVQILSHPFLLEQYDSSDDWDSDAMSGDTGPDDATSGRGSRTVSPRPDGSPTSPRSPAGRYSVTSAAARSIGAASDTTEIIPLDLSRPEPGTPLRQSSIVYSPTVRSVRQALARSTSLVAGPHSPFSPGTPFTPQTTDGSSVVGAASAGGGGGGGLVASGDGEPFHRASLVLQHAVRNAAVQSHATVTENGSPHTTLSMSRRRASWASHNSSMGRASRKKYAETDTSSMQQVNTYLRSKVMEDLITDRSSVGFGSDTDDGGWRTGQAASQGISHISLHSYYTQGSPMTTDIADLRSLIAMKIDTTQHMTTPAAVDQVPDDPSLAHRVDVGEWDGFSKHTGTEGGASPEPSGVAEAGEADKKGRTFGTTQRWVLVGILVLIIVLMTVVLVVG